MNTEGKEDLVKAWIGLQKAEPETQQYYELFWSFDQLWELTHADPETAFDVILAILRADPSVTAEENLSAGPLEDLLVCHGAQMIERIEREAATNPAFRHLLGGVWKNAMSAEVWARVQACWDRRGWDGLPA